ncbi:GINS complex Sld5 component [Rhodocollybia butyracea]|uniref:DNA replication complex GINS protein SLD5 n=1 Tax=Rhodocollybia butyracea TaxID=206335 RepID=A0A9P5PVV5_9AGAR|nr:GINS complex Sld5 component [Rhodocollybia butyracea]
MASASASASTRVVPIAPIYDEQEDNDTPLSQLTRHWMNERHAPDILPAQEELLSSLLDHIRRQSEAVQSLRGEPSASEEDHIRIMLVQMEVERVKFIVRSYVRTRLFKVEKFARFIMTDETIQARITMAERAHASRHAHLTDRHFHNVVLQSLPETQSHLDDTPIFMPPMITKPDETRAVFVHALRDCPPLRFHDKTLEMKRGHISLMPFSFIQTLLLRGDVELL